MNHTAPISPSLRRLDGVDSLRGLSILAVILLHIWIRFSFLDVKLGADWSPYTRHLVFFNGGNGVTTFFVISGFLITLTSLRRFGSLADLRPLVFYRIRFARIMPLLLLLLAVLSMLHLAHIPYFRISEKHFTLPRALFAALTFHLNWLEASRDAWLPAAWTVLWSLSIEEAFYFFFPLISLLLFRGGRLGRYLWITLALGLFVVGPWARAIWPRTDLQAENSYLAGMASIALGCLTALIVQRLSLCVVRKRLLLALEISGWAGILLIAVRPHWRIMRLLGRSGTDDALLAFAVYCVIAGTTLRHARGSRWTEPLRWFGRHSYELYLSHEFVVIVGVELFAHRYAHEQATRPAIALFVLGITLITAPLAWMLAHWFTEPMNRKLRGAAPPKEEVPSPAYTPATLPQL